MGRRPKNNAEDDEQQPQPVAGTDAEEMAGQIAGERETQGIVEIETLLEDSAYEHAQVAIKKRDPLSGRDIHLERHPISALKPDPNEFLRVRYGGGKYRLFFYPDDRSNRAYTTKQMDIDPAVPKGEFYRQFEPAQEKDDSALRLAIEKIKGESGSNMDVILAMMQMQQKNSEMMMQMQQKSTETMITAITSMVAAVKGGGGNQGTDILTALGVFEKLKGRDTGMEPLALLKFAKDLAREMGGKDDDDEPAWIKALGGILPLVMPGMQRPPVAPPAQLPPNVEAMPAAAPMPEPVKPNPFQNGGQTVIDTNAAQPTQNGPVKIETIIHQITPMLIARIESGSSPEDAVAIMENPILISDEQYTDLLHILEKPDWPAVLFGGEESIAKHRAWFDKLRELLLAGDAEEEDEPDEAEK